MSLAILWAYGQVASHRFIEFDDAHYIFRNAHVIDGLSWNSLVWAFTNVDMSNWHPLTWISHFIDRELFGAHAGGYLLMNMAWHMVAAILFYIAFLRCTQDRFTALVIAFIFAVHPTNVENVAWASSRKSIMDAVCWGAGILAYLHFLSRKTRLAYLLLFLSHIVGLMFKSMHVTFPCALWVVHFLHYFCQERAISNHTFHELKDQAISTLRCTAPLLALSGYFCFITLFAQSTALYPPEHFPFPLRVMNAIQSMATYLGMFLHPSNLAPFYPLNPAEIQWSNTLPAIFIIGLLSILFALLALKQPKFLLGWLWYIGTLMPVIGLVQVGSQSHADRYLYIPMIGLGIILSALFSQLKSTPALSKIIQHGWLAASAASLLIITKAQTAYWKDGITLFRHTIAVAGDSPTAITTLAGSYHRQERFDEGIIFLNEKLANPKNAPHAARLYRLKANMLIGQEKWPEALESIEHALALGGTERRTYLAAAYVSILIKDNNRSNRYIRLAQIASPQDPDSLKSTQDETNLVRALAEIIERNKPL